MSLVQLRDFSAADRAWNAARDAHVDAWTWCVRAILDDARDRVDNALTAVEQARELSAWYRPAIEVAARMLMRARRAAEARDLLVNASHHLEAASTQLMLGVLQRDAGELDAAVATLHRAVAWSPVMERDLHDQLAAELGRIHYLRGDIGLGVRLMRLTKHELICSVADRIEATPGARRELDVPHVPQHHNTCAPATLTAIAEVWGEPADHTEIAEEICHDGTPAGNERRWAEERGFITRQFTVTWDAMRALIDAGIPFALTTSFTMGAHLQPISGYDERRRSLLVADPSAFVEIELDWDQLAKSQAPFGPRGLVFVPSARRSALDNITLPDAVLYDHHYAIEAALRRHDRAAARAAFEQLTATAPSDHYLVHQARRALASYDGDERGTIAWVNGLRANHPDHPWLRMCELTSLHGHASEDRRAELASSLLAEHRSDAGIVVACGGFLLGIGDTTAARGAANRAIRMAAQHAGAYRLAADAAWRSGERSFATRLYRFASCLADGDEHAAWSYFVAAVITGEVDVALDHLRDRVERMKSRSGAPARTLCEAFAVVGRASEGIAILDAAIAAHPDDGTLQLVAAEQRRLASDLTRAADHLERARGHTPDPAWRRTAAVLAVQRGDFDGALALRRQLVEDDPLDVRSQHAYVTLLERNGAADMARAHIIDTCARFPFHIPLAQLCFEVLRDRAAETARSQLVAFLERQPRNAWALHRLADWHARSGDLAAARALLVRARACTDDLAALEVAEASLDTRAGRRDEAMARLLTAIRIDVDTLDAVSGLLDLARDAHEARTLLKTVESELARQGSGGTGLLAYASSLQNWYDPLTALARLRTLRASHAHLWAGWAAEVDALVGAGRTDEAAALAAEAAQRFGYDPRAWRQLGIVEGIRGNDAAQIAALERVVELEPHEPEPLRRLADAYLSADDTGKARAMIERALAEEPLDESSHGYLARIAKLDGDDASALRHLERATELAPSYSWAWDRLIEWSDDERPILTAARSALTREPSAIAPRLLLANHASDLSVDERAALLDEGIRITPGRFELYDAKAELLARHERWADALAACQPTFWGEAPPIALVGRAAWVRFHRGERDAAITDMLAAIRRTPSYTWGINQLIAWGNEIEAPIRTAERLVEAAPESALAHAVLGEVRREGNDLDGAEASFARALEIDGTHQLARLGLFDVRFQRQKYEAAEPLLVSLDGDNPYVMARRVQVYAATRRFDAADEVMARMLRLGVEDSTPIVEGITGYRTAGAMPRVEALFDRLMAEPDAPRAVALAWWEHVGKFIPPFRRWRRIKRWPRSKASDYAAACHVEQYGDLREHGGLALFMLMNWRQIRARTDLWGSVGYSLFSMSHFWFTRLWLGDYAKRLDVAPWMLTNLARSLAYHGAITRTLVVCQHAMGLPPDHATHTLLLILAPADALEDADAAARALSAARRHRWLGEEQFLGELAEALIAYAKSARDLTALDSLSEALARLWAQRRGDASAIVRRVFEYVTTRLARRLGSRRGRRWLRDMRRLPSGS